MENATTNSEPAKAETAPEPGAVTVVDVPVLLAQRERLIQEVNRLGNALRAAAEINKAAREKAANAIRDARNRERARYAKTAEKTRRHFEQQTAAMQRDKDSAMELAEDAVRGMDELRARIERDAPMLSVVEQHFGRDEPVKGCVCVGCRALASRAELRKQLEDMKKTNRELKEHLKSFQGPKGEKQKRKERGKK